MDGERFEELARRLPVCGEWLLRTPRAVREQTFDVHLKSGQPVSLCGRDGVVFLREDGSVTRALTEDLIRLTSEDLQEAFLAACGHSVFSHEEEIRQGYVLVDGLFRAGICGTAVVEDGEVRSVRDVTSLSFRIPREVRGCGDRLFLEGADLSRGLLAVGEPASGKTTLLRDVALSLSSGKFQPSRRVAVLDERGELGGGFDLGPCADVLSGYPKRAAFDMAIRMLSPEYIVCDELSAGDLEAVRQSVLSGAALIASVHAVKEDLCRRPLCRELLRTGAFKTVACLSGRAQPGEIETLERWEEGTGETAGRGAGDPVRAGIGAFEGG